MLHDGGIRVALNESVSTIVTAIRAERIPPEFAGDISELSCLPEAVRCFMNWIRAFAKRLGFPFL